MHLRSGLNCGVDVHEALNPKTSGRLVDTSIHFVESMPVVDYTRLSKILRGEADRPDAPAQGDETVDQAQE